MRASRRDFVRTVMVAPGLGLSAHAAPAAQSPTAPAKKLRLLILGGTGFTGPHQVRYALARGHSVTLFNRGKQPQAWPAGVEELLGDRNGGDLKALEGREWDVCIDNPTTLPFWVRDAGLALRGRIQHYIFISTVSVYASNDKPDDEAAAVLSYAGADPMAETVDTLRARTGELYGPLKAVSEQEAKRQFGERTTIIRPGLIVGPGDQTDRFTYWPVRLARGGEVLAPGDGSDPVQFIDARDLAEWTVRVAEARIPGTFNATGPARAIVMRDMLATIAASTRSDAHLTWVPTAYLEVQKVSPWSDLPVWVPGQGDSAGFARRSIDKALRSGLTFRPLATTSVDTLAWFRQQPEQRQAKLRTGLDPMREAELLRQWKSQLEAASRAQPTDSSRTR
jgi:2'-hydroxyisoflavone reductase